MNDMKMERLDKYTLCQDWDPLKSQTRLNLTRHHLTGINLELHS